MSCGKEFPQLMMHSVNGTSFALQVMEWPQVCSFSTLVLPSARTNKPHGLGGFADCTWAVLGAEQSQSIVEWKTVLRRRCHQHRALYISLHHFMLAVINLPRFLGHVPEWTSHCVMCFSAMMPIKNMRRKFDLQGDEKSYQRHLLLGLSLCLLK